jgi:tetratricopeptide (TPR) repeat protein
MKRYTKIFLVLAMGLTTALSAQKFERTNANNAFHGAAGYKKTNDPALLAKAKGHIDNAAANEATKGDADTWVLHGEIYLAMYQREFNDKMNSHKDVTNGNKREVMSYAEAPTTNLDIAVESFLKAKQLDAKFKVYEMRWANGLSDCYVKVQNVAIALSGQDKYAEALPFFEKAIDIRASSQYTDTVNISNAAVTAMNGKLYDKAIFYNQKLIDMKYGKGLPYYNMANAYRDKGDTTKYKETITNGMKAYPSDEDLLIADVNMKMDRGQHKEAVDQLNKLVAARPNDAQLNLVVGNVYDRLANPKLPDGKDAPKPAEYEELLGNAIKYYQKTIELDPNNYDANFNLGLLYYNQSVYYYNKSLETIADAAKYGKMWEKPLPDAAKYLEAAHKIDPKAMDPLIALKSTYSQMSDNDNYARVKEEIKKMQSGQ